MMKSHLLTFTLLTFLLSCASSAIAAEETRALKPFNALKVYGRFDVVMVQGEKESITLQSDETPLEKVITQVEDGKLKIRMKSDYFRDTEVKIVLTFTKVLEITASAGAAVDAGVLEAANIVLKANSGATVSAEVICEQLKTDVSQGATLRLSGKTNYHESQVNTGGQLDAYRLTSINAKIRLNMGGYAKVYVREKLDAAVNMGGNISFKGSPKEVKQATSLGGSITEVRE